MTTTISHTLSGDHRHCDELFTEAEAAVEAEEWIRADSLYGDLRDAMHRHLAMEEEVLFPALEERHGGPLGPTQMMRAEHDEMRTLLDEMTHALGAREGSRFLGLAETLLILIQQHNYKEENILYLMADQVLGPEQTDVLARMEALST